MDGRYISWKNKLSTPIRTTLRDMKTEGNHLRKVTGGYMNDTLQTIDFEEAPAVEETLVVAEERKAGRPEGEIQGRLFDLLRANRIGIAKAEKLANEITDTFINV